MKIQFDTDLTVGNVERLLGPYWGAIRDLQHAIDDIRHAPHLAAIIDAISRVVPDSEKPAVGAIYTGKVVRVTQFGAFIEILPGQDGMVHISQLASKRVEKVEDVAKLGDELTVMVTNIEPGGKIRLSRQAVLEGWTVEETQEQEGKKHSEFRSARTRRHSS